MNILCFGKNGQVARALSNVFTEARFISSAECDFNFSFRVKVFLEDLNNIELIINSAAYTKVDLAEEEREVAMNINYHSVKVLTDYCLKKTFHLFIFQPTMSLMEMEIMNILKFRPRIMRFLHHVIFMYFPNWNEKRHL